MSRGRSLGGVIEVSWSFGFRGPEGANPFHQVRLNGETASQGPDQELSRNPTKKTQNRTISAIAEGQAAGSFAPRAEM